MDTTRRNFGKQLILSYVGKEDLMNFDILLFQLVLILVLLVIVFINLILFTETSANRRGIDMKSVDTLLVKVIRELKACNN